MNKKEFIEMVKEMLQESLGDEYSVVEYSHVKNNKKPLSGLAIQRIGTDLGMVIYLDKVFDEYQNGRETGMLKFLKNYPVILCLRLSIIMNQPNQ